MTKSFRTLSTVLGALGLLVAVLVQMPPSWGAAVRDAVTARWPMLLLATVSLAGLVVGVLPRRSAKPDYKVSAAPLPPDRPLRPLPSWAIPAGAVLVAVVTWGAVWWLQSGVPTDGGAVQRAQLRVNSIRTGLTVGAGITAAIALLLAFRRQQLAERTQQATEYDAGEKRVTELYVKAADQLGSDKAPVRLAGLYALERLAQDNPAHRESIVEVMCAYLRMPYTPLDNHTAPDTAADMPAGEIQPQTEPKPSLGTDNGKSIQTEEDSRGERQVRLTAQRILARHLRPTIVDKKANLAYWGPLALDLTEATLIDLDFTDCRLHYTVFTKASFIGIARFDRATFNGDARFSGATFNGDARFGESTFDDPAWFEGTTFTGDAYFDKAVFSNAWFDRVTFNGNAWFDGARCEGSIRFEDTTFTGHAGFSGATLSFAWFETATFTGHAGFSLAKFGAEAWFLRAAFHGIAGFGGATFDGIAAFGGARFTKNARFSGATFGGVTTFSGATFRDEANFRGATFTRIARFGGATFTDNAEFGGATFTDNAEFEETAFGRNAWFDGATFGSEVNFRRTTFTGTTKFDGVTFTGTAQFEGATLNG